MSCEEHSRLVSMVARTDIESGKMLAEIRALEERNRERHHGLMAAINDHARILGELSEAVQGIQRVLMNGAG